jgi:hypothetical protein
VKSERRKRTPKASGFTTRKLLPAQAIMLKAHATAENARFKLENGNIERALVTIHPRLRIGVCREALENAQENVTTAAQHPKSCLEYFRRKENKGMKDSKIRHSYSHCLEGGNHPACVKYSAK